MKKCPFCAEEVQEEAVVCRYCGRELSGSAGREKKSKKRILWASLAVLVIVGGISSLSSPQEAASDSEVTAQESSAQEIAATVCRSELEPTLTSLRGISSRLDVGMVERDYTLAVGDAKVLFDLINLSAISGDANCREIYNYLEATIVAYAGASDHWNSCISDFYCDTDSVEFNSKLQAFWLEADTQLGFAKTQFDLLGSSTEDF